MRMTCLSTALVVAAVSCALAAPTARAACSDSSRPGTPNEVKAETLSSTAIRFSWRNTTRRGLNKPGSTSQDPPHKMWFDISVRDGRGNQVGKDMGGHGPFDVSYGHRSHQDFTGLSTNSTYCFKIRARTEGGTKGCVSKIFSAQVCATTSASDTPPRTGKPLTRTGRRLGIVVIREPENVFLVNGRGFLPNRPVAIRVVDNPTLMSKIVTTIGGRAIVSNANGQISVRLLNFCTQAQGPLSFSANDGRENKADRTGTLWTNTVTLTCQR